LTQMGGDRGKIFLNLMIELTSILANR